VSAPVHEEQVRRFRHEGDEWLAWLSGRGAVGTGALGLGPVDAVHFARAAESGRPLREALLARGRFEGLFDQELSTLLEAATPIVLPDRGTGDRAG